MTRMVHRGAFLVVEGKDDLRFWRPRRHRDCELVEGEGKKNVVEGVRRLEQDDVTGVLGIVDDDYDSLRDVERGVENLVSTDAHDLECMLCRSSALDTVLGEFGSEPKLRAFEQQSAVDVRTALLERTVVFGKVRWAAEMYELGIDRSAIRVERFVAEGTWSVDAPRLMESVAGGDPEGVEALERCIAELPVADPWRIANGHDMVAVLKVGLRRVLGNLPGDVGVEGIGRLLRAAMSREELRKTTLWTDVRLWEAANRGYWVLENGAGQTGRG